MKLLVISHTEHYKDSQGAIVGWGPTITEINHLLAIFEEIYHIAVLCDEKAPKSALPYTSNKIHFVPVKKVGGTTFSSKMNVLSQLPDVLKKVNSTLKLVDCFQFRAPTGMGVYLIPYLTLFVKKKGWFKYAGNWEQKKAPVAFAFQRWLLKNQHRKVTINGQWAQQPSNCISFENPCLTTQYREEGTFVIKDKSLERKLNFCFVGALNEGKGVDVILTALEKIDSNRIGTFYFIGGGEQRPQYEAQGTTLNVTTKFEGFLPKEQINEVYKQCHFIVLPSKNEGFPKVIGEAMNYGCIPIVSDVSCIGQYIVDKKNGYLIAPLNAATLLSIFESCMDIEAPLFQEMMVANYQMSEKFTYDYYNKQLSAKIVTLE